MYKRQVTGVDIKSVDGDRRAGDPPELVADASLAAEVLGWYPEFTSPRSIIETAWDWHRENPEGYAQKNLLRSETG